MLRNPQGKQKDHRAKAKEGLGKPKWGLSVHDLPHDHPPTHSAKYTETGGVPPHPLTSASAPLWYKIVYSVDHC